MRLVPPPEGQPGKQPLQSIHERIDRLESLLSLLLPTDPRVPHPVSRCESCWHTAPTDNHYDRHDHSWHAADCDWVEVMG
jgi:hypothetical protein